MKKILSNFMVITFFSTMLTGCFFGSCADWNCNELNPRWEQKMERCRERNIQNLGYNIIEINKSSIGNEITSEVFNQCIQSGAKYDARKDLNIKNMLLKLEYGR